MAKKSRLIWNSSRSAQENACQKLPPLARAYFRAGRALFAGKPTTRDFHKFRLETKRFRYTLELFELCYGPGLGKRLKYLRTMQDFLGEINDCAATQKLLGSRLHRASKFLEHRMTLKGRALRLWWGQNFDGADQESWWTNYLARFAQKPRRVHEDR